MHLIRLARRCLSLEYVIDVLFADEQGEPGGPPPGGSRVTMFPGRTFDLGRSDTELLNRHLDQVVVPDPAESEAASGVVGTALDPETGLPLIRRHQDSESS